MNKSILLTKPIAVGMKLIAMGFLTSLFAWVDISCPFLLSQACLKL